MIVLPASFEFGRISMLFCGIRIQVLRQPTRVTYPSSPPGSLIMCPGSIGLSAIM